MSKIASKTINSVSWLKIWHELIHYICTYPDGKLLIGLDCAFVILGCVVGFGTDVDAADMMFVEFTG